MAEQREDRRKPATAGDFLASLTGTQKWGGILAVLFGGGFGINGVVQFIRDAPAIVNANTREIRMHHDSLVDLADIVQHVEEHLEAEDAANLGRDRKLDYLVCIRTERARELRDEPALTECDLALLQ